MSDEVYRRLFAMKDRENPDFWSRFEEKPGFMGKSVLEVGCGLGGMCVDIARDGVREVVGLNIKPELIDFASRHVAETLPEIAEKVNYLAMELADYDETARFDCIVSKNSFEHIADPAAMLAEMSQSLLPRGRMYIGFGPIYNSFNGAHMKRFRIPWIHRLLPEKLFLKVCALDRGHSVDMIDDLRLNRKSYREFREIFGWSGLVMRSCRINADPHPGVKVMNVLRRIPFLCESFTVSMYCIREKPAE